MTTLAQIRVFIIQVLNTRKTVHEFLNFLDLISWKSVTDSFCVPKKKLHNKMLEMKIGEKQ